MRNFKYISLIGVVVAVLSCAPAQAQDQPSDTQQQQNQQQDQQGQQPDQGQQQGQQGPQGPQPTQPIPAIRSPLASAADNEDTGNPNPQEIVPDTRPLTGVENLSVGSVPVGHSYWQPRVSLVGTADSNPDFTTSNGSWATWIALLGGVDLHKISGVSDLFVSYTGGAMFSNDSNAPTGNIQALTVKDKYAFRRSTLTLFEQLDYLPESSYGFAGLQFAGLNPSAGLNLGNNFTPSQSILTPRGQNLSSTSDGEFDTRLTARTTLTFVGGYSLLRYFDDNLADFGDATFQAGYNYQVNRRDTVGVSYQFGAFRYSNLDQSINSNTVEASYGRRITGRLAFQIAAGPQFVSSRFAITNSTTSTSGSVSQVYWTLNTSLQYQLRRATIAGSYYHGVTGGSGVLAGAETDIASGSLNGQLSRTFNAGVTGGFSRNQGFAITNSLASQTFDYWFAGVNLTRNFGRNIDLFLNYQFQYQNGDVGNCTGTACLTNVTRHQISVGVNLHKQPIPF